MLLPGVLHADTVATVAHAHWLKTGNIELRYYVCFLGIMIVAVGSFAFHGTLRYDMQVLPMAGTWQDRATDGVL